LGHDAREVAMGEFDILEEFKVEDVNGNRYTLAFIQKLVPYNDLSEGKKYARGQKD
jgi:hypothetical protein